MFILQFKHIIVAALLCLASVTHAEIYKWVDENGNMQFSQFPPEDQVAEKIEIKTTKPVDTEGAQKEIDDLITSQQDAAKAAEESATAAEAAEQEKAAKAENCRIAKANLTNYQNNPGRRVTDENGNITYIKEEDRQAKIKEFQAQIDEFCN
jgi:hypothetical protein